MVFYRDNLTVDLEDTRYVPSQKGEEVNNRGLANPLLHDIPDASRMTGLSRATLYRLMAEQKLRPVKIGRSVRIPADELRAFVERLKAEAGLRAGCLTVDGRHSPILGAGTKAGMPGRLPQDGGFGVAPKPSLLFSHT